MQGRFVLLLAALLAATMFAGCSGSDAGGISANAPAAAGGAYVFTASGSADNYTWDLGDHLTVAYGKKVTHTYDFANGQITVSLTTKKGDKLQEFREPVTLGTGQNALPTFFLDAATNWTVTGESFTLSAAQSKDPDGDPLRYAWSCIRSGDAVFQISHEHAGVQGTPFATPPAGTITPRVVPGTVAAASDKKLSGDLCDALGSGTRPSKSASITGSFTKTGIYDIFLLASDPVHPSTSGKYRVVATTPDERPQPVLEFLFEGTLTLGADGSSQSVGDQVGQVLDKQIHPFSLPLGTRSNNVTFSYDQSDPVNAMRWEIKKGEIVVATGDAPGTVSIEPSQMPAGSYSATVYFVTGLQATYNLSITSTLDMDPFKVY